MSFSTWKSPYHLFMSVTSMATSVSDTVILALAGAAFLADLVDGTEVLALLALLAVDFFAGDFAADITADLAGVFAAGFAVDFALDFAGAFAGAFGLAPPAALSSFLHWATHPSREMRPLKLRKSSTQSIWGFFHSAICE